MGPSVGVNTPVALILPRCFGFIGDLDHSLVLQGLDSPLELVYKLLHSYHGCVLGRHVIRLIDHLCC